MHPSTIVYYILIHSLVHTRTVFGEFYIWLILWHSEVLWTCIHVHPGNSRHNRSLISSCWRRSDSCNVCLRNESTNLIYVVLSFCCEVSSRCWLVGWLTGWLAGCLVGWWLLGFFCLLFACYSQLITCYQTVFSFSCILHNYVTDLWQAAGFKCSLF